MGLFTMGKLLIVLALLVATCVEGYYVPGTYPKEFNVNDILQGGSASCQTSVLWTPRYAVEVPQDVVLVHYMVMHSRVLASRSKDSCEVCWCSSSELADILRDRLAF